MMKTRRQMFVALLAVGFLAAGCVGDDGASGDDDEVASLSEDDSSEGGGGGDREAELTEWAGCMRDEGVDIPDPVQDADGIWVIEGNGIGVGADGSYDGERIEDNEDGEEGEDMASAEAACGQPPGVGVFSEEEQAEMEADALEYAECMRDEGIEGFPDPDFSDMGSGGAPQDARPADGGPPDGPDTKVDIGPFHDVDLGDPATVSAMEVCDALMDPSEDPDGSESDGADA